MACGIEKGAHGSVRELRRSKYDIRVDDYQSGGRCGWLYIAVFTGGSSPNVDRFYRYRSVAHGDRLKPKHRNSFSGRRIWTKSRKKRSRIPVVERPPRTWIFSSLAQIWSFRSCG